MGEAELPLEKLVGDLLDADVSRDLKIELLILIISRRAGNSQIRASRLRDARKKARHTPAEWRRVLAEHGGRCAKCGTKRNITKDHIVPIVAGGSDGADNLQPLCGPCNSSKWANTE